MRDGSPGYRERKKGMIKEKYQCKNHQMLKTITNAIELQSKEKCNMLMLTKKVVDRHATNL